jgi:hypothetical protein
MHFCFRYPSYAPGFRPTGRGCLALIGDSRVPNPLSRQTELSKAQVAKRIVRSRGFVPADILRDIFWK